MPWRTVMFSAKPLCFFLGRKILLRLGKALRDIRCFYTGLGAQLFSFLFLPFFSVLPLFFRFFFFFPCFSVCILFSFPSFLFLGVYFSFSLFLFCLWVFFFFFSLFFFFPFLFFFFFFVFSHFFSFCCFLFFSFFLFFVFFFSFFLFFFFVFFFFFFFFSFSCQGRRGPPNLLSPVTTVPLNRPKPFPFAGRFNPSHAPPFQERIFSEAFSNPNLFC